MNTTLLDRPGSLDGQSTAQQAPAAVAPVSRARRLVGVDATRGVALLGMMAVHSLMETDSYGHPTLAFAVFGGRAAATFAVMAGVGLSFMTGRRRVTFRNLPSAAALLLARALTIGAIGLALGYADASVGAVILPYYAVLFALAIPFLVLPNWAVALAGLAAAIGMPALVHVLLPHVTPPTLDNPTLAYLVQHPARLLIELTINGEYPALPWLAYLCAGLVVGRLRLSSLRTAISLAVTGLVLAVGAAVVSSMLLSSGGLGKIWAAQPDSTLTIPETTELLTFGGDGTTPASTWWWLAINAPHTSTPPDLIGTIGSAIALLGVLLLLGRIRFAVMSRVISAIFAPLAAAGSMTLTLYAAHIAFINSEYDVYEPTTGYLIQVVAVLLIGLAWRATAGRGPLESLVTTMGLRAQHVARRRKSPQGGHPDRPGAGRLGPPGRQQQTAGETP